MEFDLVDGGDDFGGGVVEEDFEVFDAKVGDANVADFACCGEFLHFLPGEGGWLVKFAFPCDLCVGEVPM